MAGKLIYNLKRKRHNPPLGPTTPTTSGDDSDCDESTEKFIKLDDYNSITSDKNVSTSYNHRTHTRNETTFRAALRKIEELEMDLAMMDEEEEGIDSVYEDEDSGRDDYYDDNDDERNLQELYLLHAESEALGFAVCAKETLNFLQRDGLPPDSQLVTELRNRLIGKCDNHALINDNIKEKIV